MVSFRKCILALTVLVLFAGLASAQVGLGTTSPLTCATNVSVTPTLRSEGYTEQTGDITITCTGGTALLPGAQIPAVNIQLFLNTTVTSRLLPITSPIAISNASEALLLVDEPGSGLPGYGPLLTQKVCPTPNVGCVQYVGNQGAAQPLPPAAAVPGNTFGTAVDACTTFGATGCVTTSSVPGANVFQGLVSGNSVTFFGVPVLPPVTSGAARVYRITNVRANATILGGGSAVGATAVTAGISISGATSLLISQPSVTVGFVSSGLDTTGTSSLTNQNQCSSTNRASINTLTFTEKFGTAFKTRIAAQSNAAYAGQGVPTTTAPGNQNIPGTIYNSESNFVLPLPTTNGGGTAGLSDFGTRLKATFTNIPKTVRLFVSTTNVNNNAIAVPAPTPAAGAAGANIGTSGFAQLVSSETINDGTTNGVFFPAVTSTDVPSTGNTPIVEIIADANGTATATWEVINTNPNAIDSLKFGVYTTYSANVAQNLPPQGITAVTLSYAPTPPTGQEGTFAAVSSSLPIPRFNTGGASARNIEAINLCRTVLLYPFLTNSFPFDTGLAISNTSTDPFGTGAQAGTCRLSWYQGANNPPPTDVPAVASGQLYTAVLSQVLPPNTFTGYMIAVCNFQYAHGFAFISDLGTRNFAMGYLALVIPDPGTGSRVAQPGGCNGVSGCAASGESDSH